MVREVRAQIGQLWWLVSACMLLLAPTCAFAARTPYRSSVQIQGMSALALHAALVAQDRIEIPTIRVSGVIFGEGRIDARFTTFKPKTWRSFMSRHGVTSEERGSSVALLQGKVSIGRGYRSHGSRVLPAAASVENGILRIVFPGKRKGRNLQRQRLYTISVSATGTLLVQAKVSSIPSLFSRIAGCASAGPTGSSNPSVVEPITAASTDVTRPYRVVTIATDADTEWFQIHGEQSNNLIAAILNAAEAIYERQLGIRFRLVRQHVYQDSSPYTTNQPGLLLAQFADNPANAANLAFSKDRFHEEVDLKHLFTGRDLAGGVVGIAYIGTVCAAPVLTFGVTQSFPLPALPGIFAHELGHNFGAAHDQSDPKGLMYPNISLPSSTYFSQASLDQISEHLSEYNTCLSTELLTPLQPIPLPEGDDGVSSNPPVSISPTPTPGVTQPSPLNAVLYLMKRRVGPANRPVVRLYGKLVNYDGVPFSGQLVRLVSGDTTIGEAATDMSGGYEFFVRVNIPPGERLPVGVETLDGRVKSNPLSLRRTESRGTNASQDRTRR